MKRKIILFVQLVIIGLVLTTTNSCKKVKKVPVITWEDPADISLGTELSATQLNATADVDGKFVFTPPAETILSAGKHSLLAEFTPTDIEKYNLASKTVRITVVAPPVSAAVWTSATEGTINGIAFTITNCGGAFLNNYDLSTSDYSAGPLDDNETGISYQGASDWTITFDSPVTNLKLYCIYWRTDTYTFDHSFNILSGTGLSANGNILSAVSYAEGIVEFPGTISSITVTSTQVCCSNQAMTFGL